MKKVDVHCAGETGSVITGGVLDIFGATVAHKLDHINKVDNNLRSLLGLRCCCCLLWPLASMARLNAWHWIYHRLL
jgi:hypothetical protein